MSVSEGNERSTLLTFLAQRVRRDLQFSNIFRVDFAVAMAYAVPTVYFLRSNDLSPDAAPALMALVVAYAALHMLKIALVWHLERSGGDAREFVGSDHLVTSGFYAYSRNPVYLLSLFQSFIWSLILICLATGHPSAWIAYALAPLLLYGHYWGIDRLIVPHEEAALGSRHPEAFAAYCARVRRWIGRRSA